MKTVVKKQDVVDTQAVSNEVQETEVLSQESMQKVDSYVSRYNIASTKSASSVLELAEIIFEAHTTLNEKEHEQFLISIQCLSEKKKSYLAKMRCIAQDERLKPVVDRLPSAYTTLYTLTKISDNDFERMKKSSLLCPEMSEFKLNAFLRKKNATFKVTSVVKKKVKVKSHATSVSFAFDLEDIPSKMQIALIKEIQAICASYKVFIMTHINDHSHKLDEDEKLTNKISSLNDLNATVLENEFVETEEELAVA